MKKILLILLLLESFIYCDGIVEGKKILDFRLKSINGQKYYTIRDFEGEVVFLNLWGSWCRGCKKEMPEFFRLQKEYEDKKFKIVTVNIDGKKRNIRKFLRKIEKKTDIKTPFLVLYDMHKNVARRYKVRAMPSSYLIDKNGIVRLIVIGSLYEDDIKELKKEIDKLL